ncbi:MAG: PD-(D/E)XK nuclease family protein [Clostridia bacterium]|nr:PD-(D/E)XK nuclease family protein [Clostridia bacterium]
MINVYYGRENLNKEKFIFEKIKAEGNPAYVLVPDQYSLEAEKQALKYMGSDCLMDVEITNISRLGENLINKYGPKHVTFLDKYGRQILLDRIAKNSDGELKFYTKVKDRNLFIAELNNFISQLKQYGMDGDKLATALTELEDSNFKKKLEDLALLTQKYEKAIEGKYTDSEDKLDIYIDKISSCDDFYGASIWIYGFDSFSPKNLEVIKAFYDKGLEVNIVISYDPKDELFQLGRVVMDEIKAQMPNYMEEAIGEEYIASYDNPSIEYLEKHLFDYSAKAYEGPCQVELVAANNQFSEAENAAAYVLHLVRDCGLRLKDIMLIANDTKTMAGLLKRSFDEYDISLFLDSAKKVESNILCIFVNDLIKTSLKANPKTLIELLKTGFMDLSREEIEALENYMNQYKIRGEMVLKAFKYGNKDGAEAYRQKAIAPILKVRRLACEATSYGQFIQGLRDVLEDDLNLKGKLEKLIAKQLELMGDDALEISEESKLCYQAIYDILKQIATIAEDDEFSLEQFQGYFQTGMESFQITSMPQSADNLILGTAARTRKSQAKAVIIVGANEGVLPADLSDEVLFTADELERNELASKICKLSKVREQEEKLAIYRNVSKARKYLMISYSKSNQNGEEMQGSELINILQNIFGKDAFEKDILSRGDKNLYLVGGKTNTQRHLTEALRRDMNGVWKDVLDLMDEDELRSMEKSLNFQNHLNNLDVEDNKALFYYDNDILELSPSRLERFSRCPFNHFVKYGLQIDEERIFEAGAGEVGDVVHASICAITTELSQENKWDKLDESAIHEMVDRNLAQVIDSYKEELFKSNAIEKYRVERIREVLYDNIKAIIYQAQQGNIKAGDYEVAFGKSKKLKPIKVETSQGPVEIYGIIDRLDTLQNMNGKVIDYKTGKEVFNAEEAKAGYRLQLMLYLKAAEDSGAKPAAVFYFPVSDKKISDSDFKKYKDLDKKHLDDHKMNGVLLDDAAVIGGIDGAILENDKDIKKSNVLNSDSSILSPDEFEELRSVVWSKVEELCEDLNSGKIDISPMRSKDKLGGKKAKGGSACDYCPYKTVCRFDKAFGNKFIDLK